MNGIRAKITADVQPDGKIRLAIAWVQVIDSIPGEVLGTEEFQFSSDAKDWAYVSRAVFPQGEMSPGTFFIDSQGLRHFFMSADPGTFPLLGREVAVGKEV